MEVETLQQYISSTLKAKAPQSSAYRKALTIFDSIISSTQNIPNFRQCIANTDSNFALFLFGSVYKLLIKDDSLYNYSLQSMLLLINQTISHLNVFSIKQSGILQGLQSKVYQLLTGQQNENYTPLMIRLACSILNFTLINNENIQKDKQSNKVLCNLFNFAVQSHRTNVLSKQASKMLTHLVKNNEIFSKILARHANMNMLGNIEANLYLNNVRQVISQFPRQLVNDIGYRVCKKIGKIQIDSQAEEIYLTQIYFFLEKLTSRFSTSTLQEICKQLISNIPSSAHSQSKTTFCYLQALHSAFQSLVSMNQNTANKLISSVVSILLEFITKGGKVQKQAYGILKSIMNNCIRKSLWSNSNSNDDLEALSFDNMDLNGQESHNYQKLVCMIQSMLSDEYKYTKGTGQVLTQFFNSLDQSSFEKTYNLIQKVIEFRQNFDERVFKNIVHSIFGAMKIERICQIYPMSIQGNIADENFQARNNLWLAYCCQKYEGQEQQFQTYMTYFYPLLVKLQHLIQTPNLTNIRKQAYKSLKEIFWRCLKIFCHKAKSISSYQIVIDAIKNQINIANDSVLDHISQALQNLCLSLSKQKYKGVWPSNLISLLAKNLNTQKSNSKQILKAIKSLSKIAQTEYLNRVFDKNINKLITQVQKSVLNTEEHQSSNIKNIQILIAVSHGINFVDPSVVEPLKISRQELVVKLIQLLLSQNNIFQKKAYKYIFQIMNLMGSSFKVQIMDLISVQQHQIIPSSKHYRMSILNIIWKQQSESDDNLNQNFAFIKTYLPQIMINMREPNQRTRKSSTAIFNSFCQKLNNLGLINNFIEMMCAGLATDSVQMKIATLCSLSSIFTKKYEIQLDFCLGILQIVLMLLYEKNGEIFKAIVDFSKRFIFSIEKTAQAKQVLKTILEQFFKVDQTSRLQHRSLFKHFMLKLVKKFTRQTVQSMIPAQDRKMLTNAIKIQNRQKKKKRQLKIQRRADYQKKKKQAEAQKQRQSDSENSNQDGMEIEQQQQLKDLQNNDNLLLKYDLDQENFHFEEQKLNIRENLRKIRKQKKLQGNDITFEQGMMVVKQLRRERNEKNQTEKDNTNEDQNPVAQAFLNVKKRRKLNDVHVIKESGQSFRSNKARGDVRTRDKPEPYAFIQFNSKALNKRFKKKAEKAFDSIFEKHEGGLKGIKSKIASKH